MAGKNIYFLKNLADRTSDCYIYISDIED